MCGVYIYIYIYIYEMRSRTSTYTIQFSTEIVHLEEFLSCTATDKEHAGKPAAYLTISIIELCKLQ